MEQQKNTQNINLIVLTTSKNVENFHVQHNYLWQHVHKISRTSVHQPYIHRHVPHSKSQHKTRHDMTPHSPVNGQWWSINSTQRLHTRQYFVRYACIVWHCWHIGFVDAKSCGVVVVVVNWRDGADNTAKI